VTPTLFLAAALALGVPASGARQDPPVTTKLDSLLARRLHSAALDRQAELDYDSSLVLLRAARAAHPDALRYHLELIFATIPYVPQGLQKLRREYAAMPESPLVECLRAWIEVAPDNRAAAAEELVEIERRYPAESCPVVLLAGLMRELRPERKWAPKRLEYAARAVRLEPDWSDGWVEYASALAASGRLRDAERVYAQAIWRSPGATRMVLLFMRRAGLLQQLGDAEGSEAIRRAVSVAVERDGRPGVRLKYLHELAALSTVTAEVLGSMDTALRQEAEIARKHGSLLDEWQARYTLGLRLTNRGEPLAAIEELSRAIIIAEEAGIVHRLMRTLHKRAAAFVRSGRHEEAERDLLRAVELIPVVDSPYTEAETWHGLVHLYDGSGRPEEALRASSRFIAAAERMPFSPLRVSAWLDAGELRWKAGQHAAANRAFARLVDVVDDYDEYHAYAGQYFERIGDLEAARYYYERGARSSTASADGLRGLNWAGLSRVYLALGALDSAEVLARRHDSAITEHSSVPILPALLAERGTPDEGAETAATWARSRLEAGAVRGAAAAHVLWADLLLRAGRPTEAVHVAARADSLARSVDDRGNAVEATLLRGLALEKSGDSVTALRILDEAARMAIADGDLEAVLAAHVSLGRVLASQGKTSEALEAWGVAARMVETATMNLELDFDRVRYRQRRLAPYEAALLTLLERREESNPASMLAWSQRRKAAALRLVSVDGATSDASTVTAVRNDRTIQVAHNEVLLDYNLLDNVAFVLVVGPRKDVEAVRLELTPDSIRSLVARLRAPFNSVYAGSIDLTRLQFRQEIASELFEAIIAPVWPLIEEADRLLIAPDGPLHWLSFASLVVAAGSPARQVRFLVEDFEILYVPSAARDRASRVYGVREIDPFRPAAVIAGRAPGTRREIETLASIWPGTVHGANELPTKESALSKLPARPAVLHVASHAIADDRDPYASHIRLAADSLADGLLHGAEIGSLQLEGSLVVLSACETGKGPLYAGEGLLGLQRSFVMTGASGVLATLWPVSSSAADLIEFFYGFLLEGDPPVTALRRAQLQMLSRRETAHPFHWAGFTLLQPR